MKKATILIILIIVVLIILIGLLMFRRRLEESKNNYYASTSRSEQSMAEERKGQFPNISITPSPTSKSILESSIPLQIISPADKAVVKSSKVTIRGKTVASAEVSINEKDTKADASGNFAVDLTLDEGENLIIIVVNDSEGKASEAELTLTYEISE
jgi:hypothetical protein